MTETLEAEAPEIAASEETGLYHVHGEDDLLLYIGISNDFGRRWKEHAARQAWWAEKCWMTVRWYGSREDAETAEEAAIRAERPKHNKMHNDGRAERPAKPARCVAPRTGQQERPARLHTLPNCMYMDELRALPMHVDLATAGRAWSLGRDCSYELMRRDEFPCPVQRRGRYYRVLKADLVRSLGLGMDGRPVAQESGDITGSAA